MQDWLGVGKSEREKCDCADNDIDDAIGQYRATIGIVEGARNCQAGFLEIIIDALH